MISRNKGFFSLEFLVPIFAFLIAVITLEVTYRFYVRPLSNDFLIKRRIISTQGGPEAEEVMKARPLYIIIKDEEPKWEIIFCFWGMIILAYKLVHVTKERRLFKYDFVRVQPGERIIPEDA